MFFSQLLPFLTLGSLVLARAIRSSNCSVTFEGRIPLNYSLVDFESNASLYRPDFVYGKNLSWSQILNFDAAPPSLFDGRNKSKSFEVKIDDRSIFVPSNTTIEMGFRRADLLPAQRLNGTLMTGKQTLHFSLRTDWRRPLNYSHEYMLVFLETADYKNNQIALKTGTMRDGSTGNKSSNRLVLQGNQAMKPVPVLHEVELEDDRWYNYGIFMDFNKNTTQVLFSKDQRPLRLAGPAVDNDLGGQGEMHFGVLKKPTGNTTDPMLDGYQPSQINEGMIFGGIFQEDSKNGCVSYKPSM